MSDTHDDPNGPADASERPPADVLPATEAEVVSNRGLARVCWGLTTLVCLVTALVVLIRGDNGYAAVTFAVALAAGINLF